MFWDARERSVVTVGHEDLIRNIRSIAERVTRDYGLEVFDVQLRRESIGWVLRVVLDRQPGGGSIDSNLHGESVSVGDCQQVSQDLSAVFDVEVRLDHAYTLEVSSPGLDRPLRHLEDCRRFVGRLATIVTTEPVDGQHYLAGRIIGVETDQVVIAIGQRTHRVPWPVVSRARLDVEF